MTKTPISLQDLRRSLYVKAKAETDLAFLGTRTFTSARWKRSRKPTGWRRVMTELPEIDGVTFEAIEESGRESFLKQIQSELVQHTYQPMRVRKKEIPKDGGNKVRVLSIPTIRDRVVQACAQAHPGADLRSRFPIGIVRIPTEADSSGSGAPSGTKRSLRREDTHHRS